VLLCEGEVVLACLVAYRRERFTERERHHLQRVVPLLRARLALERQLDEAPLATAALGAALDLLATPAFVVDRAGEVLHANTAARRLLAGAPDAVEAELRAAASSRPPGGWAVTGVVAPGACDHFLVVKRREEGFAARVAAAAAGWALTPRQRDTLALLAQGRGNRDIAAALGCSERTVEEHVSACFEKAACETRLELVARFWAGVWRVDARSPSR
jgi:DNA-binding CsgD family transcriptional regulator